MKSKFAEINVNLIDVSLLITEKFRDLFLGDVYNYGLKDKLLTNPDVKKLFYHHFIDILLKELQCGCNETNIVYFCASHCCDSEFTEIYGKEKFITLLTSVINKLKLLLPIKIYQCRYKLNDLVTAYTQDQDENAIGIVKEILNLSTSQNGHNTSLCRFKKFAQKQGLTYITDEYLTNLNTKYRLFV